MMTLEMISVIENRYGSLYQIAENLISKSLPRCIVEDIISFVEYDTNDILPEELLTNLLLDVLEPIDRLGAISLGEEIAVQTNALI